MPTKPLFKFLFAVFAFSLATAGFFVSPTHATNKANLTCLAHHSQGATITKDSFLYTDRCSNSKVKIYKCNRKGTQISNCKKITQGAFKHANALDHKWGSDYFWILDSGGKKKISKSGHHWCYSLTGEKASSSKCGSIPNSSFPAVSGVRQGFAIYGKYRLKGTYNKNKIYVFKGNKKIKVLSVGHDSEELEDVMVDGDTGKIYFSTSRKGWVKLYKYDGYTLPVSNSGSTTPSNSGGSSSSSSSGNGGGTASRKPTAKQAPTPNYDGTVKSTFFGNFKDDGNGCGTYMVLNFIIDILAYGIGIIAIIGIAVSGITYLNAKGNQEQTTKAKHRLYEIVIGIAAYAVLYIGLNFLLPGGKLNSNSHCSAVTSSVSTTDVNPWQQDSSIIARIIRSE